MKCLRLFIASALVASAGVSCSSVRDGSRTVERKAADVGERIEAQAVVAKRKAGDFWRWLFGGDGDQSPPRRTAARANSSDGHSGNTVQLESKSQPYIGAEN
jgi:hypothetical protein